MYIYIYILSVKSSVESKLRQRMCVGDTFGSSSRPLKRIERLQPLRGDWSLASARFTVPIVRPVKRKRVLSSLHVRIRYPDRRLAHVCWK